ncbi:MULTISPECIES: pyruvate kinase [Pseudoalteromonas]|uniref:Pyruvate kinase n=1 Tax=Pseudoalteromonas ruthenica TaxID=151081 RepID=A0A0F4PXH4_9GAMM|nr:MULTISPECIES: pyruvate kinase [Pseudoalteromonas]KJY99773.1 pyruvate kinase [Pseudoalteromonas ruthenica]KJY99997.1 pyruvate kinase [Pseudoalteromonas ruthenica]MCG7564995.1 pyruvate kinase [Pseudoalteromonas sp. CnMc7-15]RZF80260.1 pyruvate kinase [Pseudoalteromonas sp. CO325X]TLX49416.1 pyruvate kinase [Pseudoalteromonas ruthenica]|tara:strand:+ start:10875 stop:12311 length:1437 start_codon:yes stop_codon:yes gene_type:complete
MPRRTKIVATLGPATDRDNNLEKIIRAGANVVRLNFSHGVASDHQARAEAVREIAQRLGTHVAILADLQGPKIRVSTFKEGKVNLAPGAPFILDAALAPGEGDVNGVGIDYKELPQDVKAGDLLLLNDGLIQLTVERVEGQKVHCSVKVGGVLSNNKGINRLGGGLTAPAFTDKDKEDLITATKIGVDYIAVSFPRSGDDMRYVRSLAEKAGSDAQLLAKIERAEAVETVEAIDDIILASDAVMVARGDLGVEIGDAELVGKQKTIISRARSLNRVVITATQMMESMIDNPMPTRAEVMDVANAVLDGTDAVMLSAETAAGDYPEQTVATMARVCLGAESQKETHISKHRLDSMFADNAETIALSAMYAANHLGTVKAIVALTESGNTSKLMSRISSGLPIYSLSRHGKTLGQTALYRGVYPVRFDSTNFTKECIVSEAMNTLVELGELQKGDTVILTHGDLMETIGATNTLKIVTVG